ncbi:MAG: FAD-binding protein [Betaproteobacteria bacterium]|nr:FAD-binding protein [Betaproteobacteria bacterium]
MLAEPFVLAGRRLRNRLVHASMSTRMVRGGMVTDEVIRFYANRAKGGAAMIVTEPFGMADEPTQHSPFKTRTWNDDNVDGLRRWADAVEAHDCRLLAQIQHSGRARHDPGRHRGAVGPSALPCDLSWTMPREMTRDEIRRFVEGIAQSSSRLQRCGFSGVEISAGHGHLFHQFLSPRSNIRVDEYGGDWQGRTRFVAEILSAVRKTCGPGFIVGLKLPGDDGLPNGIGPAQAAIVASMLTRSGEADYVCFAQGAHASTLEMHVPDRHGPRLPYRKLIAGLRAAAPGVPLIALGRITDPAEAEAILSSGEAELVGIGRALVADPAWLVKAESGRAHDIRYCLSCNTCWDTIVTHQANIACVNNPRVGKADEVDWWPEKAGSRRRIVVVGGGIAGLEAAWVAAARGHDVLVFSRSAQPGGKARLRSFLPGGEEVSSIYDYQMGAAQRAGVRFEFGVDASLEEILSASPDAVILAAGADMIRPDWVPAEVGEAGLVPDLRDAVAAAVTHRAGGAPQPGTAVIFDMDHSEGTYAAAEFFRGLFERVILVTPRNSLADLCSLVSRQGIERRFSQKGIEAAFLSEPRWGAEVEEGRLACANIHSGRTQWIDDVALITYSTPRASSNGLAPGLRGTGIPVTLVGDCRSPADMLAATAEGHAAGNAA